jgi:hypothetical protein
MAMPLTVVKVGATVAVGAVDEVLKLLAAGAAAAEATKKAAAMREDGEIILILLLSVKDEN